MPETDKLIDHFRDEPNIEVDHAIHLYINTGRKLTWRDMMEIRECGYKVQDITSGENQTQVNLVRDSEGK